MRTVNVLHFSIGGSTFTGIASFLQQYYKHMDRNAVHFDFIFAGKNSMQLVSDDPIFADSSFIELHAVSDDLKQYDYSKIKRGIEEVLQGGNYDIFHINAHRVGVTLTCIAAGKKCGIKTIISHSHGVRRKRQRQIIEMAKAISAAYIRNTCDFLFACSEPAGKALFGSKGIKMSKFNVIKNAIDTNAFSYNELIRKKIRNKELVNDDTIILGQIGRLTSTKNQLFSLEILSELMKRNIRAELWLIGSGEDQEELEHRALELNICQQMHFFGLRTDVAQLMQGMDAILFPSLYEGLGIVAIESQAAGLPTYASTQIPLETKITDLISYLPLSDGPERWADYIINDISNHKRKDTHDDIIKSGFEISNAAKWLEEFYINCTKE